MGNPTTWKGQSRTFNANNQETTGGTTNFAYDGNGNPTTYKGAAFTFDENDKLTSVGSAGNVTLEAGYRSDGLRGWKDTANGTTYFLYDGNKLLCEFDANGNLRNTNVWGANGLLARDAEIASSTRFYLWDDRGNIAQSLNENGTVATNYNVSAWGDVTSDVSSNDVYAGVGGQLGNYRDVETGLLLCGQRHYDASSGRWLNRDPIGYDGGLNLYGYVTNNPTNYSDPSGLARVEVRFKGGGAYHAYIIVSDNNGGNPYIIRFGPTGGGSPSSDQSSGSSSSQSSGSRPYLSGGSSNNSSNSSNSSSVGSSRGGVNKDCGSWGPIEQWVGPYNSKAPDWTTGTTPTLVVIPGDSKPRSYYYGLFRDKANDIGVAQIPYGLMTTNSNAAVSSVLSRTGLGTKMTKTPVWAPGWSTNLPNK